MTADLSVTIGSLKLPNPLIAASGCFGYGLEYDQVVDLSLLGGIVSKGLFMKERQGHPPPRIVETPAGMIRAVLDSNVIVSSVIRQEGAPGQLLRAALEAGKFTLVTSPFLLRTGTS